MKKIETRAAKDAPELTNKPADPVATLAAQAAELRKIMDEKRRMRTKARRSRK